MCLVIGIWNEHGGTLASEGRMMAHIAAPVAFGSVPKQIAGEDVFKVHRIGPSLIAGIVGWAHVCDELLASLKADLGAYDEEVVSRHMLRLKAKYPGVALQAALMGVRDGKVHAGLWCDADPSRSYAPRFPKNQLVMALGDTDIAREAVALARRGTPLKNIFEVLAQRYCNINSNVHEERIP